MSIVACIMGIAIDSTAQTMRTIAGTNTAGYSGDGGFATHAKIGSSWGVATDANGNLFVTDDDNNVIRKIRPDGTITTLAGTGYQGYSGDGGLAAGAALNYPSGLAVDAHGNVYVADNGNYVVRKIDTLGIITTVAGTGTRGNAGDGGPAVAARLAGCVALSFDQHGNLYIADGNGRVRKVTPTGLITTAAGNGMWGYSGDGGAATNAAFAGACGVAVDVTGNIFIADQVNNVIRKVNTSGIITTLAGTSVSGFGGDGGPATNARLNAPGNLITDNAGNVYVADVENNRIRMISQGGIITTIAGNGAGIYGGDGGMAIAASVKNPSAICLNKSGNMFIADRNNYVVREIVNHAAFTITANPGSSVSEGTTVTFKVPDGSNNYGLNYQWYCNGLAVGGNSATYTPATVTNGDRIICKLVDPAYSNAMETSDDLTMSVSPLKAPEIVANNVKVDISLYPNPNKGNFEFNCLVHSIKDEYLYYGIFDVAGRLLISGDGVSKDKVFHAKVESKIPLPPGQYTLLVAATDANNIVHFEIN